jgi:hypothetical protein
MLALMDLIVDDMDVEEGEEESEDSGEEEWGKNISTESKLEETCLILGQVPQYSIQPS